MIASVSPSAAVVPGCAGRASSVRSRVGPASTGGCGFDVTASSAIVSIKSLGRRLAIRLECVDSGFTTATRTPEKDQDHESISVLIVIVIGLNLFAIRTVISTIRAVPPAAALLQAAALRRRLSDSFHYRAAAAGPHHAAVLTMALHARGGELFVSVAPPPVPSWAALLSPSAVAAKAVASLVTNLLSLGDRFRRLAVT